MGLHYILIAPMHTDPHTGANVHTIHILLSQLTLNNPILPLTRHNGQQ